MKHESLVELLQSLDVDKSETRLLTNLYWKQTAAVRCGDDISEWLDIKQGVRQGFVASPHLFALYMRELDDRDGFRIGGTVVNNLRYADDTVIIAESEEQLQRFINVVVTKSEEKGLYLYSAMSFTMVFSKASQIPTCNINFHGKILEQVHSFVYLGSQFTSDARCEKEIRRRIEIAKSDFTSMRKVLTSRNIHMTVRIKVLRCYVWLTLLYGCETWTISVVMQKKLEAFETWLYRRMLRISWNVYIAPNGYSLLVVGVPQSGGLCKLYPPTTPLRRHSHPVFLGSQPCVHAAWLAERLLLAGHIESNPGPKPTLKTLSHTHQVH